ncbi:alpha/beta hydrolase family protein [Corynebacterium sp. HMSC04H06]|uniref:alpha/beta hydrolase n=1 Tax=Corynebacterium sp. HMSC04H06 TaxID=1581050 RepID=UPI0008A16B1E|nr:alpha/beta fold hydrolase [Corynebacterium sp. HMSC04H06]OFS21146.1 esterase [Corynebacterium sp. HMSC04H06]
MNFLSDLPLAEPVDAAIVIGILVIAAGVVVWQRRWWPVAVAAVICIAAGFFLQRWDVPFYLVAAAAVPLAALIRKPKVPTVLAGAFSLLATVGLVNIEYQTYPDVGSLDPTPVAQEMSLAEFQSAQGFKDAAIVHLDLPGTRSQFAARQAIAYVPPAYWRGENLPVVVLLHGNPGGPDQWFGSGEAAQTADQFQAANDGRSPIIVAVDSTGSETANPICADSSLAHVMTYLSQDVPAGIKQAFRVNQDQSHWTVAGLSYGGTCALQIATNQPTAYGSIVDISGEAEPTIGSHQATVDKFFGGDEKAFNAQDPAHLLKQNRYPGLAAVFIAGDDDHASVAALSSLSQQARAAGMRTYNGTRPGGHSFQVWRPALREVLAWAAQRGGMKIDKDPFDGIEDQDVRA